MNCVSDSNSYNRTHPAVMAFRSVSVERHNHRIAGTAVVRVGVGGLMVGCFTN